MIAARAAQNLGLSELDARTRAARERAVIMFGDPNIASLAGFGLDPQAGTFARQNYLSGNATLAQLDKQHELRRKAIINRLAGRGILFSGDLGYLSGEAAQQHGQQVYTARQQLLDWFADLGERDAQQRGALRQLPYDAYNQAYGDYIANPDVYGAIFGAQQKQADEGGAATEAASEPTSGTSANAPASGVAQPPDAFMRAVLARRHRPGRVRYE